MIVSFRRSIGYGLFIQIITGLLGWTNYIGVNYRCRIYWILNPIDHLWIIWSVWLFFEIGNCVQVLRDWTQGSTHFLVRWPIGARFDRYIWFGVARCADRPALVRGSLTGPRPIQSESLNLTRTKSGFEISGLANFQLFFKFTYEINVPGLLFQTISLKKSRMFMHEYIQGSWLYIAISMQVAGEMTFSILMTRRNPILRVSDIILSPDRAG